MTTTPLKFIEKWKQSTLKERAAAQEHFIDLCNLFDHPTPATADPEGTWFTFEYGAQKTTGSKGFADVWKKGFFGWEYKGKKKNLQDAYAQLQQYAPALANPPLLIVCDTDRFEIYTNWNDLVSEKHVVLLEELENPDKLNILRHAFFEPDKLKPTKSRQQLTEEVAGKFATLSESLRKRGEDPHQVAHFINRLIFCMFAEDVSLLPKGLFTDLFERGVKEPLELQRKLSSLFKAMKDGSAWGVEDILWFNGGLFDDDKSLKLEPHEIKMVLESARKDWSDIDPSIMGTLFERGLDPSKQSQLGAHYTDRDMIMKIINPVIIEPLLEEWSIVQEKINEEIKKAEQYEKIEQGTVATGKTATQKELSDRAKNATASRNRAKKAYDTFKSKLQSFKVLDPACGSGNFLYLSLKALKDIEQQVNFFGEMKFNLPQSMPEISPSNIYGIEINQYAAELARVSVWVGEIQWIKKHGFTVPSNPVLKKLNNIVCHDALINEDGSEYHWPKVSVIVGNPPFIGDKKMFKELGKEYTLKIRSCYDGQIKGRSDFVCYWFLKSRKHIEKGDALRAGLVSTNSIRQASNRGVLEDIKEKCEIYRAYSDEPWAVEGAAVRVSIVCFGKIENIPTNFILDGNVVVEISASLDPLNKGSMNISKLLKIKANEGIAYQGIKRVGQFELPYETAKEWLLLPENPNGRSNSDVLKPWISGADVTKRPQNYWIVDYGWETSEKVACLYEKPFEYLRINVKPERVGKREKRANEEWWIYYWPRPEMRKKLNSIKRYIVTVSVAKHRLFRWINATIVPDGSLVVVAREDDFFFGMLHSIHHVLWATRAGSWMGQGNDPAYTPTTSFETFPFPEGLEPNLSLSELEKNPQAQKISEIAKRLNELRENWLNPSGCVKIIPEVVVGYPDRIIPVDKAAEKILSKRTLTNLYNENPTWLKNVHKELDDAVAEAYGWPTNLSDEEILERLFALNQQRGKI